MSLTSWNIIEVILTKCGNTIFFKKIVILEAGGKPSTWFPPGGLVEHIYKRTQKLYKHNQKCKPK